jgi:chemotaxis protein histidine kinase CheA
MRKHLAECGDCRQVYADFRRVSAGDLGLVAALKQSDQTAAEAGALVDESAVLGRLLDRATRERVHRSTESVHPGTEWERQRARERFTRFTIWLRRPALSYGSLGLILCIVAALGAYRLREAQLMPTLHALKNEVSEWKNRANAIAVQEESTSQSLQQAEGERERLRKLVADAEAEYAALQRQQRSLEAELASERAQLDRKGQELEAARSTAENKNEEIAQLETRVQNAVQRTEEQRRIAENLQSKLQWAQQQVQQQAANTPESQGFGDAEAKELFGARDLHIVDVYDVDIKGNTRRSYGRVYYVEKRLLIFYAFDLQDKKHSRAAAAFQAWGYRQPSDGKPESLGLFEVDDERIDAVFVTLEPPNGSPSPRGRRLLYANLAGPANHP